MFKKVNLNGYSGCVSNNNNDNYIIVTTMVPQKSGSIVTISNLLVISAKTGRSNIRSLGIEPEIAFKNVSDKVIEFTFQCKITFKIIFQQYFFLIQGIEFITDCIECQFC